MLLDVNVIVMIREKKSMNDKKEEEIGFDLKLCECNDKQVD